MKTNDVDIINLGCRLNIYEGEVIKSLAHKNNLSNFTIINSCAVTQEAEKKVKYEIRKSKKNFPEKKIILRDVPPKLILKNMPILMKWIL